MNNGLSKSALRRRARKLGFVIRKSRAAESTDQCGGFMLIEADRNLIVLGGRFDATFDDIAAILDEMESDQAEWEAPPNSPTIVCIDASRGYVPGNIEVVSQRAATLLDTFRDLRATPLELRRMADWIEEINAATIGAGCDKE